MIKGMYYEAVDRGTSVCKFGQKGDTFHILLEGKCSVWLPLPNERISEVIQKFQESVKLSKTDKKGYRELRFMCWDHDNHLSVDFDQMFDPHRQALSQFDHKVRSKFEEDLKDCIKEKLASDLISNLQQNPQYLSSDTMHHIFTPEEIMELNVPQNHIKKRVIDQMWESLLKRVKTDLSVCDHSENDSASDEEHMLSVSAVYLGTLKEIKRQILAKVFRKLPNHRFRIDGQNYEYLRGQYFYEIAILKRGSTFGELALLSSDNLRSATVFCETNCQFATIHRKHFSKCLGLLQTRHNLKLMNFLLDIPSFKGMKRNQMNKFIHLIKQEKFTYGQTVYTENDEVHFVYIVNKGDFELQRKLKKREQISGAMQTLLDIKPRVNILQAKLTEIIDTPSTQKLAIFGPGTILGEEDFIKRKHYSCSLKCSSLNGTILKMTPDLFDILMSNQPEQIQDQVTVKESWLRALQIQQPPRDLTKEFKVLPNNSPSKLLEGRNTSVCETGNNLITQESITEPSWFRPAQRTQSQMSQRPSILPIQQQCQLPKSLLQFNQSPSPQHRLITEPSKPQTSVIKQRPYIALSQVDNNDNSIVLQTGSSPFNHSSYRVSSTRQYTTTTQRERYVTQAPIGKTFANGSEIINKTLPLAFNRKSVQKQISDQSSTLNNPQQQQLKTQTKSSLQKFTPNTRNSKQVEHLTKIVTEMRDINQKNMNNQVIMRSSLSKWTKASFQRISLQQKT